MVINLENQNTSFLKDTSPAVSLVYFINLYVIFGNNGSIEAIVFNYSNIEVIVFNS